MRLGSDPEVFLVNNTGKFIAVNGLINHGKNNPMQVPQMENGFTLQEDNVALEYGIPPASTSEEFQEYIMGVMDISKNWLPGLDFSKVSCTVFEDDQLQHPLSRIFGCEPDYNAYTKKTNPKPIPEHPGLRSAGGHIHVETNLPKLDVVKAMDFFLAIPAMKMDKDGAKRRKLYGKPGAFRGKPYGVEYRTLSNFWIFERRTIDWVWRNTERALSSVKDGFVLPDTVREIIERDDQEMAENLIKYHHLEVI